MNSPLKAWTRALELTAPIERPGAQTLPLVIDALAERHGGSPALSARESSLTYRELAELSHRYTRWALQHSLAEGHVVALLLPNCPEYLAIWLGLTRAGIVVALLNTNLTGDALAHAINIVSPRHVIAGAALSVALRSVRKRLAPSVHCWAHGEGDHDLPRIDTAVASLAATALPESERAPPALDARALYIYTSGTTGLPKAAVVSHFRLLQWSHWFAGLMNTTPSDRMYNCLPMYHSIGGVVATGATLVGGGTVVVRERFSAREFWADVIAERCTLFQYIGELCRYLLASPPHPDDTRHALRLCCGNGLRAEVWEPFKKRFRIPQILEYYAATEGSFSLYNCEGRPGAIGRIPPFLSHRVSVALVQHDEARGAPVRDAEGRCVRCAPNEIGEALGEVTDGSGAVRGRFEGYADARASQQKLLRDVFAPGDAWYRTGDLMRRDEQGFFYFVDRVGDTFRWKGENVSTSEVSAALASCAGVAEAAVYGVRIPNTEGRCGMAALVVTPEFDLEHLQQHVRAQLPEYARPMFVRLVPSLEITGTFKLKKQELAMQGYDPQASTDPLYFDDRRAGEYVRLDGPLYQQLTSGALRV